MKSAACRFWSSVSDLLPETAALIFAVGLVLGVFPVIGFPTLLCAAATAILRVNLPAVQLVNQLSSPLQWLLVIPFAQCGARIMGGHNAWSLAGLAWDAIAGWFCMSILLGPLVYYILLFALRRCRPQWFNGLKSPG